MFPAENSDIIVELDFKHIFSGTLNYYSSVGGSNGSYIYTSNDGINYTKITATGGGKQTLSIVNARYIRIVYEYSAISQNHILWEFYLSNVTTIDEYEMNFIYENENSNFVDNQIINVYTPNYEISSLSSMTLNDIGIDSVLQPNKYYELVYNEDQNKFIAEEVRN